MNDPRWAMTATTTTPNVAVAAACCSPVAGGILSAAEAERLAARPQGSGRPNAAAAAVHGCRPRRRRSLRLRLDEPVGLSQGTVSDHMKVLVEVGLLTPDQRGKWAF